MSTLGKMSVGVRRMTSGLISRINSASTMNVYGRVQRDFNDPQLAKELLKTRRRFIGRPLLALCD